MRWVYDGSRRRQQRQMECQMLVWTGHMPKDLAET